MLPYTVFNFIHWYRRLGALFSVGKRVIRTTLYPETNFLFITAIFLMDRASFSSILNQHHLQSHSLSPACLSESWFSCWFELAPLHSRLSSRLSELYQMTNDVLLRYLDRHNTSLIGLVVLERPFNLYPCNLNPSFPSASSKNHRQSCQLHDDRADYFVKTSASQHTQIVFSKRRWGRQKKEWRKTSRRSS